MQIRNYDQTRARRHGSLDLGRIESEACARVAREPAYLSLQMTERSQQQLVGRIFHQHFAARLNDPDLELELGRARAEGADSEDRRDALRRTLDSARGRLDAAEARLLSSEFDAVAALVRRPRGPRGPREARPAASR